MSTPQTCNQCDGPDHAIMGWMRPWVRKLSSVSVLWSVSHVHIPQQRFIHHPFRRRWQPRRAALLWMDVSYGMHMVMSTRQQRCTWVSCPWMCKTCRQHASKHYEFSNSISMCSANVKRTPCQPSGLCSLFSVVVPLASWIHRISKTFIFFISPTHCSHLVFFVLISAASIYSFLPPLLSSFFLHELFI